MLTGSKTDPLSSAAAAATWRLDETNKLAKTGRKWWQKQFLDAMAWSQTQVRMRPTSWHHAQRIRRTNVKGQALAARRCSRRT